LDFFFYLSKSFKKNMKTKRIILPTLLAFLFILGCKSMGVNGLDSTGNLEGKLPIPNIKGTMSTEESIAKRASVRLYQNKPLSIESISQLLYAAQGISHSYGDRRFRTAPSAGATYPLETYLFAASGVYKYNPIEHSLERIFENDKREELSAASLGQTSVSNASIVILFTMVQERTEKRYGNRAYRYICMEAGHAAQNIHLQAVALGLASVPIGAFTDEEVSAIIGCPDNEHALYMVPVGFEKEE
jgi:SagB-type dehydrogenase family enzyme